MADPRDPQDDEQAIEDPALDAVLDAILSETPVDWGANGGVAGSDPALAHELRVLAGIAAMHRGLERGDAEWGHLQIREKVGEGAFGEVFRAFDPHLNREVALKLFAPSSPLTPRDDRAWVLEEARHLAAIKHPNVVTVHGADRIGGRVGFWTEFIKGQTLTQLVESSGPLAESEAIAIGIDVCRALSAVHGAGLLHRDIKANNVMREEGGRIVLLDFGATRNVIAETPPAAVVGDPHGPTGTPLYVAPELWLQQPATAQSDVYSVGVLLYFLVTGTYPVRGATVQDVANAHRDGTRTPLRAANAGLSAAFVDLVEQAIAPDPASRFADVNALQDALKRAQYRPHVSMGGRSPKAMGVAAMIVVAVAGGLYWWLRPKPVPALRVVKVPDEVGQQRLGPPSHDGRFYAYLDASGRVHTWEIASLNDQVVTPAASPDNRATSALMSPNGDRVAYVWKYPNNTFEVFVTERKNPSLRRSVRERRSGEEPVLKDWSRDGDRLLGWLMHVTDNGADLVLIPASGGATQLLFSRPMPGPNDFNAPDASLSPDQRFVVTTGGTETAPYVSIIDAKTREEHPLIATGTEPSWTRDGEHVVFHRRSKVGRARDLWIVSVANGVARNEEKLIVENVSLIRTFLTDDSIYAQNAKNSPEVYLSTLDFTGQAWPRVRMDKREIGGHSSPSWSPDGRLLAYMSMRPGQAPGSPLIGTLTIRDVESGSLQVPRPKLGFVGSYAAKWWPDGKSVIVLGTNNGTNLPDGFYRVDLATGDTRPLLLKSQASYSEPAGLHLSRDATTAFYLQAFVQADHETVVTTGIVRRVLDTGREDFVVTAKEWPGVGTFGISPDERSIAFSAGPAVLVTKSFDGASRELVRAEPPEHLHFQTWSADGKYLIFLRSSGSSHTGEALRAVSVATGEEIDLRIPMNSATNPVSVRPGTNEIAYPERVTEQELWIRPLLPHIR